MQIPRRKISTSEEGVYKRKKNKISKLAFLFGRDLGIFLFFLGQDRVFLLFFLAKIVFSFLKSFFYKFPPQKYQLYLRPKMGKGHILILIIIQIDKGGGGGREGRGSSFVNLMRLNQQKGQLCTEYVFATVFSGFYE